MGTLIENYKLSSIVRASDEDFANIYPNMNLHEVYKEVSQYCPNLICTANKEGVFVFTKDFKLHISVPQIKPLSTVGAGDSFNAGFVYALIHNKIAYNDIPKLSKETWTNLINTAVSFSTEVCLSYENFVSKDFAQRLKGK